jgi:hypothetical protein
MAPHTPDRIYHAWFDQHFRVQRPSDGHQLRRKAVSHSIEAGRFGWATRCALPPSPPLAPGHYLTQSRDEFVRELKPFLAEGADQQVLFDRGGIGFREPPEGVLLEHFFGDVVHVCPSNWGRPSLSPPRVSAERLPVSMAAASSARRPLHWSRWQ